MASGNFTTKPMMLCELRIKCGIHIPILVLGPRCFVRFSKGLEFSVFGNDSKFTRFEKIVV
jgi:hypothetical protein